MRFAFIKHHRLIWSVVLMCEVLQVSRSGFYKWLGRTPSATAQANATLEQFLVSRADALRGIPGYRKLHEEAVVAGYICSPNRVQRLLQGLGYRSVVSTRPGYRKPDSGLPVLPNLLNREFDVADPDRVWVSDITQIRCFEGWLYVAVVLDLFNREIIGLAMGAENRAQLVSRALNQAWRARLPDGSRLMFHSDQGAQYRSEDVMRWLTRRNVTISMSRRGNCWDNACSESFFSLLKKEWIHRLGLVTRREMITEVEYYSTQFYNTIRTHGTLGLKTPASFGREE